MKDKLIAWMNTRRYNSHWMRLLVGGYVAYMGTRIMLNQYQDGVFSVPLSFCAVLLIVLGLPIALISLYAVFNGYSAEYKGKTNIFQMPHHTSDSRDEDSQEEE